MRKILLFCLLAGVGYGQTCNLATVKGYISLWVFDSLRTDGVFRSPWVYGDTTVCDTVFSNVAGFDTVWSVRVWTKWLGSPADSVDSAWIYRGRFRSLRSDSLGTGTDSVGRGWIDSLWVNYISGTGVVKPSVATWDAFQSVRNAMTVGAGGEDSAQFSFSGALSDTIIVDSMITYLCLADKNGKMDSIFFRRGFTSTGFQSNVVWADTHDIKGGAPGCYTHTYTNMNAKFARTWRPYFIFSQTGGAGNMDFYTAILYCHYQ